MIKTLLKALMFILFMGACLLTVLAFTYAVAPEATEHHYETRNH